MHSNIQVVGLKNSDKKKEKQAFNGDYSKKEKANKPKRHDKRKAFI